MDVKVAEKDQICKCSLTRCAKLASSPLKPDSLYGGALGQAKASTPECLPIDFACSRSSRGNTFLKLRKIAMKPAREGI